jgi:hypothetical protein
VCLDAARAVLSPPEKRSADSASAELAKRTRSKLRKVCCQSLMYCQSPWNSLNPMVPERSTSKMVISILTVSGEGNGRELATSFYSRGKREGRAQLTV